MALANKAALCLSRTAKTSAKTIAQSHNHNKMLKEKHFLNMTVLF